jgi:hypothetical protein
MVMKTEQQLFKMEIEIWAEVHIWGINQQGSNNTASSSSLGDDNNSGTGQRW